MGVVRLLPIALSAVFILVAQAALDAMPAVIAMREGGMGLGSALILGQAAQVAALAVGAASAVYLLERGSVPAALLPGALLLGAGLVSVGLQPLGALDWVLVAHALAGAGFGIILTAAFAGVATITDRDRPVAIALLLLAPLAARGVIGVLYLAGPLALTAAASIVLAGSLLLIRLSPPAPARGTEGIRDRADAASVTLTGRRAAIGGVLLGVGLLVTLAGADPSRVSAVLLVAPFGWTRLEELDAWRRGMLLAGLVLVLCGAALLLGRPRPDRWSSAVAAILLATLAGAGMSAALRFATPAGGFVPGERGIPLVGVALLVGAALGTLLGGFVLVRRGSPRLVGIIGTAVLASATALGAAALILPLPQLTDLGLLAVLLATIGLGGGIAASALRLLLVDVPTHQRGLAAAAGVVAASFGSALGTTIGNGEGIRLATGESGAIGQGLLLLAAAGAGAALVVWLIKPAPREAGAAAV